ncbi:MAG: hypothetical protein K8S55_15390, partial [Phycisphaerae bacterium]|nr:hypothetical protein [Phycisphaerae bacterium]
IDLSWLPRKKRGVSMPPDIVGICTGLPHGGCKPVPPKELREYPPGNCYATSSITGALFNFFPVHADRKAVFVRFALNKQSCFVYNVESVCDEI